MGILSSLPRVSQRCPLTYRVNSGTLDGLLFTFVQGGFPSGLVCQTMMPHPVCSLPTAEFTCSCSRQAGPSTRAVPPPTGHSFLLLCLRALAPFSCSTGKPDRVEHCKPQGQPSTQEEQESVDERLIPVSTQNNSLVPLHGFLEGSWCHWAQSPTRISSLFIGFSPSSFHSPALSVVFPGIVFQINYPYPTSRLYSSGNRMKAAWHVGTA